MNMAQGTYHSFPTYVALRSPHFLFGGMSLLKMVRGNRMTIGMTNSSGLSSILTHYSLLFQSLIDRQCSSSMKFNELLNNAPVIDTVFHKSMKRFSDKDIRTKCLNIAPWSKTPISEHFTEQLSLSITPHLSWFILMRRILNLRISVDVMDMECADFLPLQMSAI